MTYTAGARFFCAAGFERVGLAKETDKTFNSLLTGLGFEAEARPSFVLWRWPEAHAADATQETKEIGRRARPGKAPPKTRLPWRLGTMELSERKGVLAVHKLALSLNKEQLIANLAAVTRKYFGPRTDSEFIFGDHGEVWCIYEFTRPGSREKSPEHAQASSGELLPHGVAGFSFRLAVAGNDAEIIVSDYFGFGHVPGIFPSSPHRLIVDALGLKAFNGKATDKGKSRAVETSRARSIYELAFPLTDPAFAVLFERQKAQGGAAACSEETEFTGNAAAKQSRTKTAEPFAELRKVLAAQKAPLNSVVANEINGWELRAPAEDVDSLAGTASIFVPLEVLESRERQEKVAAIDKLILAGKFGEASAACLQRLAEEPLALHLIRRLSLAGMAGPDEGGAPFLAAALKQEPRNKLFLSFAISRALEAGDRQTVLALLSRLGAELMGGIRGADTLKSFDLVLPELLGDAWVAEDRRKAEECYHRIIQRRGDLPRILRKLIGLAKAGSRPEIETSYLMRLAQVERRRGELAKIHFRLAELRCAYKTGHDEAIDLALTALKFDRSHYSAALLAAELLVAQKRAEEAIQLADGILRDQHLTLPARGRSRLEGLIGIIWFKKLGRADLAETRFEQAIKLDAGNTDALRELEAIYRLNSNVTGLVGLLEQQFDAYERASDAAALRRVFDELVSLYRGMLGQPRKAYELYQRLLAGGAMEPEEIERVLAWRDIDIDWRDLYLKLTLQLPQVQAGERRARFLCRLGEICRERLADPASAQNHFLDAMDDGWIDQSNFTFLVERLTAAQDYSLLVRCYERRLERVEPDQRRRLILDFLAVPQGLPDARRDLLAVKAYELDPTNDRVILMRLSYYQSLDDADGIDRVLSLLAENPAISTYQKNQWLRAGLDSLGAVSGPSRFEMMDALYRKLLKSGEDNVATLQEAIESMRHGAPAERLSYYVVRLLAAGYLPPLDEKHVTVVLNGMDRELALFHALMSYRASQPPAQAQHARTAAAIYTARGGEDANTEKMLGRVSTLVPVSDDDLQQLASLVENSGNYVVLARAFHKQAELEDEKTRKAYLLEKLGTLYWKKMRDLPRARQAFGLTKRLAPAPWRIAAILARIAEDAGDAPGEKKAQMEFLIDPAAPQDLAGVQHALTRLIVLGEEPGLLLRAVAPHIEHAAEGGHHAVVGKLSDLLFSLGITSTDLYKTAFLSALMEGDDARTVDLWWRGLSQVSNRSRAKIYVAETRVTLEKESRQDLLLQCFQAALANNIEGRLGPKLKQELLVLYGGALFDTDLKRRKSLAIFHEAFMADREDNRTWMPLYFLLQEFGTPAERQRHLAEIVPLLDQDPRPLKNFPITIESLKAELKELTAELGAPADTKSVRIAALSGADSSEALKFSTDENAKMEQQHARVAGESSLFSGSPRGGANPGVLAAETSVVTENSAPLRLVGGGGKSPVPQYVKPAGTGEPLRSLAQYSSDEEQSLFPAQDDASDASLLTLAPLEEMPQLDFDLGSEAPQKSARPFDLNAPPDGATEMASPIAFDLSIAPPPTSSADEIGAMNIDLAAPPPEQGSEVAFDLGSAPPVAAHDPLALNLGAGTGPVNFDLGGRAGEFDLVSGSPNELNLGDGAGLSLDLGDVGARTEIQQTGSLDLDPPSMPGAYILPDQGGAGEISSVELAAAMDFDLGPAAGSDDAGGEMTLPLSLDLMGGAQLPDVPQNGGQGSQETVSIGSLDAIPGLEPAAHAAAGGSLPPGSASRTGLSALNGPQTGLTRQGLMSPGFGGEGGEADGDVSNWRASVIKGDFNADLTAALMKQAFASEIEKHLAIQTVSLVAGTCDRLSNWHWRVWRNANEFGYPLNGKDRYPAGISPQILHSSLNKLVIAIAPLMVKVYRDRFTLDSIARRLQSNVAAVEKLRKPVAWDTGLLPSVGFKHYGPRIAERRYKAFNLPGLGKEIFYEGGARAIYFDEAYYKKAPPSHLFHRILGLLWSVRIHYFVPLALHPQKQVMPLLSELHQNFAAQGFSRLKTKFGSKANLSKHMQGLDTRQIKSLYEKVGMPTEDAIAQLWDAMRIHIQRLLIAETLDVIGAFEALLDRDLLKPGVMKHSQLYELSPFAKGLIEFVTKLQI